MPAPTPNMGQLVNATNTGYNASDLSAITLSTHTGDYNTTANGQTITGLHITGQVRVRHDDITFRRCKIDKSCWNDPWTTFRRRVRFENCTIGLTGGYEAKFDNSGGGMRISDFVIYRCNIFGFEDLIHPLQGNNVIYQCYLHHPYHDLASRNQGGGDTHNDPVQMPAQYVDLKPVPLGFSSMLIQGNRFETFYFEKGQTATGTVMRGPATSGAFNFEFGNANNTTFRDNYVDGDYSQAIYNINGNNPGVGAGAPKGTVIIDNIFKKRRPLYGSKSFMNFGGSTVVWGRNVDADDGTVLKPFYTTYQGSSNGNTTPAGPSSNYPSFTGTPPPPPPPASVELVIDSPADASTHTSGSVLFHGGADTGAGDSADNYNWFDYYALYTNDAGNAVEAFLDHDAPTANTGFTFTGVTSAGVTFTDRAGVTRSVKGPMTLRLRGLRKDGTVPVKDITVTFGTVTPPSATGFAVPITATTLTNLDVDQTEGGVPNELVRTLIRFKPTPDTGSYPAHKETGQELVRSGGRWIVKGSDL